MMIVHCECVEVLIICSKHFSNDITRGKHAHARKIDAVISLGEPPYVILAGKTLWVNVWLPTGDLFLCLSLFCGPITSPLFKRGKSCIIQRLYCCFESRRFVAAFTRLLTRYVQSLCSSRLSVYMCVSYCRT